MVPHEYLKRAVWVEPKLVVEGEFTTWTMDKLLRQTAFKGVREDKPSMVGGGHYRYQQSSSRGLGGRSAPG